MRVILKEQIECYRLAVAKIIFLSTEQKYTLIRDIKDSSLMLVHDRDLDEKIYISILAKPAHTSKNEHPIHVFYQKPSYNKFLKGRIKEEKMVVHLLSEEFDDKFAEAIEYSFYDIENFLKMISEEYVELFEYYFKNAHERISKEEKGKLYKYYSKKTIDSNNHNVNDGTLSFTHPKYFNDPFDCNCTLANNQDMSDKFRVLCLTHEHDNILMWSYYAENHTGYCFEFLFNDLIEKIKKLSIKGLCIYGDLKYDNKRPKQKTQVNYFSFTDLNFYIDAAFTKYSEWKHEKESRFAIISSHLKDDFISVLIDINKIYGGCKGSGGSINSNGKILNVDKLIKDNLNYRLQTQKNSGTGTGTGKKTKNVPK